MCSLWHGYIRLLCFTSTNLIISRSFHLVHASRSNYFSLFSGLKCCLESQRVIPTNPQFLRAPVGFSHGQVKLDPGPGVGPRCIDKWPEPLPSHGSQANTLRYIITEPLRATHSPNAQLWPPEPGDAGGGPREPGSVSAVNPPALGGTLPVSSAHTPQLIHIANCSFSLPPHYL